MIIKIAAKAPISSNNGLKTSKTSLDQGFHQQEHILVSVLL